MNEMRRNSDKHCGPGPDEYHYCGEKDVGDKGILVMVRTGRW